MKITETERTMSASAKSPRFAHAARPASERRGFTLIEMMIVMALIALLAGGLYPTLQFQFARVRTMASAKQVSAVFQRARLEAIRRNTTGVVRIDIANRRVVGDVDGVIFLGLLSAGVDFGAPGGELVVDGFGAAGEAVFTVAGGVEESGAFRIIGPRDNNFVEVRIEPSATARIAIRKWDGTAFKAQGEGGVSWTW